MSRVVWLAVLLAALIGPQGTAQDKKGPPKKEPESIVPQVKEDTFKPLFNGKNLKDWKHLTGKDAFAALDGTETPDGQFKVEKDVLRITGTKKKADRSAIVSTAEFPKRWLVTFEMNAPDQNASFSLFSSKDEEVDIGEAVATVHQPDSRIKVDPKGWNRVAVWTNDRPYQIVVTVNGQFVASQDGGQKGDGTFGIRVWTGTIGIRKLQFAPLPEGKEIRYSRP